MNTMDLRKLNRIIWNIQTAPDNVKIVREHFVVIDDNEIYRPALYISAEDYIALCKLAGVNDTFYNKPIADIPHIRIQKMEG